MSHDVALVFMIGTHSPDADLAFAPVHHEDDDDTIAAASERSVMTQFHYSVFNYLAIQLAEKLVLLTLCHLLLH